MITKEQAKTQLRAVGVENPTDEQIASYMNNVNAEANKEKARADKLQEKADKADELQTQVDELQSQNLSESEKLQRQIDALQQQNQALTSSSLRAEARAILKGANLGDDDVEALIPGIIAGVEKTEDVKQRADAYVAAMNKFRDDAIKEHDKELLEKTKTPGGDGGDGGEKTAAEKLVEKYFGREKDGEDVLEHYI